jgi:glucose/arabinose dehydrogenase
MGLVTMLVLAVPLGYNFTGAQETDHNHTEHGTETAAAGPSVNDTNLAVELAAEGLTLPTAMAFLDENKMLVLEKDNGTVRMVENGKLQSEPLLDVAVANDNERGMLGIAVSKENETTTYVFLYFTESGGGIDGDDRQGVPPAGNLLYRYELQGDQLVNQKLLLDLPALPGPRYNGGPVVIGPDDNVYVIIGDVEGHATQVQNFENGSAADGTSGILRVGKNGELPAAVIGTGAFGKYYFAYGIRNSFGMAFDPETDILWDTENGPAFGDEINLVDAGFNSGWRDVQGVASEANLTGLVLFNARSHYSNPEFTWTEPIGPTALAFLDSNQLGEEYQNDMFVGDINNGAIYHFDLNENRSGLALEGALADTVADTPEESEAAVFGTGFGGVTDIKTGPDGNLYVLSFIDGAIFRVVSADVQEEDEASLTVRSADLSGDTITGMFTAISSSNGTVLQEGYTPLTFTRDEGSTYTVTVADFGSREFDHWDDETTNRTRTVTLDQDTTITAHYDTDAEADTDSSSNTIDRIARILDGDDCFDEQDERRLGNAISKLIRDIFGENEENTDRLERELDRIIEDCADDDGSRRGQGNQGNGGSGGDGDDDDD